MMNTMILRILLFGCVLAGVAHGQPNFVLILADDMGWTGTSVAMDERVPESKSSFMRTPNIEVLAKNGMRFSRAYSPGALCTPSRAAILTGKTPARLHMTTPGGKTETYHKLAQPDSVRSLPENETTLAALLKERGYACAHFGKWHVGGMSPEKFGFGVHDGTPGNSLPDGIEGPKDVDGITRRALEFVAAQDGKPFFVQLSHFAVHKPLEASEKARALFSGHEDAEFAALTYDLDQSIGKLIKHQPKNTYIVFTSDNGAGGITPRQPRNLPLRGGKGSLYEGGIRVPMVVVGPGIPAGETRHDPVSGCDLLPTLIALASGRVPNDLDGSDLRPLLFDSGDLVREDDGFLFHFPHYGKGPRQKPQTALVNGRWKLIRDLESGEDQLFDLESDIGESRDVGSTQKATLASMQSLLQKKLNDANAQLPTLNPKYDPTAKRERTGNNRR